MNMSTLMSYLQLVFFSLLLLRFFMAPMLHRPGSKKNVQLCMDCLLALLASWLLVNNPTFFFAVCYLAILAVSGVALVVDLYVTLSWTPPSTRRPRRR